MILPEYNGQRTDTSDPGRQEERMWRRRRVPEDAEEEDNNQKSKERRTSGAFKGGTVGFTTLSFKGLLNSCPGVLTELS